MSPSALDTPMMRQYLALKADHSDALLLYRMGDFYELFLDDAVTAAPLLDIALTSRDKGKTDPVPMCGIPVHSAGPYIKQLAELGHRVAICEQVEDAREAGGRRLLRREVVEVVTPGLVGDPADLEALREVPLVALCLCDDGSGAGLAVLDASTGDFRSTEVTGDQSGALLPDLLLGELERIAPRELLLPGEEDGALRTLLSARLPDTALREVDPASFDPARAPASPRGFDSGAQDAASRAAAALLAYLGANQPYALEHPPELRRYQLGDTMLLDLASCAHLELFENGEDRGRDGTLFQRIDATVTPPGARRLARWLRYPLLQPEAIATRQAAVAHLADRDRARARLRDALRPVRDLERLLARVARPTAVPRDLGALRDSLSALPELCSALAAFASVTADETTEESELLAESQPRSLPRALREPVPLPELSALLHDGLIDDPPIIPRGSRGANETGYIREGYRSELDVLREGATKGREWIAGLEAQERAKTGISNLKARYHPVHGYSLEVAKAQLARVPEHYERKQTLASVERFTTPELREVESSVMGAHERAAALEREIFEALRQEVLAHADPIRSAADAAAELDVFAALAEVARRERWVCPEVDSGTRLEIKAGRHPVVEAMLGSSGFVPNDTQLDPKDAQLLLLTGPNMSGKSTYLRQVALIVLLAQIGSFVPAEQAKVGAVDRVFTRVGASDRLARGESTFMVEMRETAEILDQATPRSLLILDEIGRGTSTFDGLSIAWAVVEFLHDTPRVAARTLFATHYHELTDLAQSKPRVRNGHFEAREWNDQVVFLRKLVEGGANRSYGIQVAKLAGLPDSVVRRARAILANLESGERDLEGFPRLAKRNLEGDDSQLALFAPESGPAAVAAEVLAELEALDPDLLTPMDALAALQRWKGQLADEEQS